MQMKRLCNSVELVGSVLSNSNIVTRTDMLKGMKQKLIIAGLVSQNLAIKCINITWFS